jgi:hypothetical protein
VVHQIVSLLDGSVTDAAQEEDEPAAPAYAAPAEPAKPKRWNPFNR